jgi:peptide/nickel transport system substrate-binding protein
MTTRRILILLPALIVAILLQSYFWVPTYESQTKGNPHRLEDYITASIGDADILNPILSADSASSDIEGLVFEGLIDRDKDLNYRGRLATSWEISEEAYFSINGQAVIPGLPHAEPSRVAAYIKERVLTAWPEVTAVSLEPARQFEVMRELPAEGKDARPEKIRIQVSAPARIRLTLDRVDPELFKRLEPLLGADYFKSFESESCIHPERTVPREKVAKWAAELVPATEHNPVILFHLRPHVRFHDGYLFSAQDVKFTYDAIMNPKNLSPRVSDFEPVKSVTVVDPLTVKIVYKRLYSPAISSWSIGILPTHLLDAQALRKEALAAGKDPDTFTMRDSRFNRHPVGCGPFRFHLWKSDQYIELDRFKDYWEGAPNYRQYIYRIIPDTVTQEMEFYAGTIDSYAVQPHQVARLRADKRFQSFSGLSFGYTYIGYNMRRKPFDDPRVRRALGMAIDVNKIIRYVLHGQAERISGPFVKQTDYYDKDVKPLPYDPKGALALLESAGWKKNARGMLEKDGQPLHFTLITNNGNDIRQAILAIAQDSWKRIGINVTTDVLEWSVFIQKRVDQLDFDALVLGWQMGIDPDLYQIWHSSQTHPYQLNFVGFKNAQADDLIVKIRQEYNHKRQVAYCHQLHRLIAHLQPYTFLYVSKWTAVLDKRIVIKEVGPDGQIVYKPITPTKTGSYTYDFNHWIKLAEPPAFAAQG